MQKIPFILLLLLYSLLLVPACNNNEQRNPEQPGESENDIDAARNFIQQALYGDFETAQKYMLKDSLNIHELEAIARLNSKLSTEEKEHFRTATIRIHETKKIDDSTSVIIYSNSYKNIKDSLKVVKSGGEWLVDFKYIFNHNNHYEGN